MPKRKDIDPPSTTTFKVRIPIKTKIEALKAKEAGYWSTKPELSFFGYLLDLGLKKYQKVILPAELEENTPLITGENKPEYSVIPKEKKRKGA